MRVLTSSEGDSCLRYTSTELAFEKLCAEVPHSIWNKTTFIGRQIIIRESLLAGHPDTVFLQCNTVSIYKVKEAIFWGGGFHCLSLSGP